jgi:uncharacterized DUF497 family protein
MGIEWDPNKAKTNLEKHGVRFSDAEAVLYDPNALSFEDTAAQDEQRFVVIGRPKGSEAVIARKVEKRILSYQCFQTIFSHRTISAKLLTSSVYTRRCYTDPVS